MELLVPAAVCISSWEAVVIELLQQAGAQKGGRLASGVVLCRAGGLLQM